MPKLEAQKRLKSHSIRKVTKENDEAQGKLGCHGVAVVPVAWLGPVFPLYCVLVHLLGPWFLS